MHPATSQTGITIYLTFTMPRPSFLLFLLFLIALPHPLQANDRLFSETLLLAEQGDKEAQFSLGLMYDTGNLVERSHEQAVYWYKKAAAAGVAGACLYLGMKYEFGIGVNQDRNTAQHLYEQAAIKGWPQAAFLLGSLYLSSPATDQVRGCAWLGVAADQGYPGAKEAWQQDCSDLNDTVSQKIQTLGKQLKEQIYPDDPAFLTE